MNEAEKETKSIEHREFENPGQRSTKCVTPNLSNPRLVVDA
jgi:hypothetical protein